MAPSSSEQQQSDATGAVVPAPLSCGSKGRLEGGGLALALVLERLPSYNSERPLVHGRQMCLFSKQGSCGGREILLAVRSSSRRIYESSTLVTEVLVQNNNMRLNKGLKSSIDKCIDSAKIFLTSSPGMFLKSTASLPLRHFFFSVQF